MYGDLLNTLEMKLAGHITKDGNRIILTAQKNCTWKQGIYAWVEVTTEGCPISVLYVGKAGKTLKARCRQHTDGLANAKSKVGRRNARALREAFERDNSVVIYARKSATARIFEQTVTLNDAEEEAANYVLKPKLNPRREAELVYDVVVAGKMELPEPV